MEHLSRGLRPWIALLYRLRDRVPHRSLLDLYFSMIHLRTLYLIEGWGTANKKWRSVIQVLLNQAIRAIYFLPPRTPRAEMYQDAARGILPVLGLYDCAVSKYTFEVTHGLTHSNIEFQQANGTNGRRHHRLLVPRTHTKAGDGRISVAGPRVYNTMPMRARTAESISLHTKESRLFVKLNIEKYL